MMNAPAIGCRILVGATALFCGAVIGAALAVAVVEGGPNVWFTSYWGLGPNEIDAVVGGRWLIDVEWRVAYTYAVLIAIVAIPLWGLATWRGVSGWRTAILLGFVLSALAAMSAVGSEISVSERTIMGLLIGCAGATAGVVTLSVDQALRRKFIRVIGSIAEP